MTAVIVRYQLKPDRVEENLGLIAAVFAELEARDAKGFTYKVFQDDDGVSFMHVVVEHDDAERSDSLQDFAAFRAFLADIDARCDVPPEPRRATVVAGWR